MNLNLILGTIAAFLIAFVYLNFLRRMDIFEKEEQKYSWMVFGMGVAFTFLIIPFQLYFPIQRWLPDQGGFLTRFMYHFLAVGLPEEFLKILPFLIMLALPRIMNESYDYIKYASAGALGFATIENVLYFEKSLYIIESRAFYTAILHMFTSSFIAYRFYFAKRLGGLRSGFVLLQAYIGASAIHGLYNALMSDGFTYLAGIALVAVLLVVWGRMQNNLLNLSEFFNEEKIRNQVVLAGARLLFGWALVFFYACGAIALSTNIENAKSFFNEGILFGLATGIGLYASLARPHIKKGRWFPLLSRSKQGIPFIDQFDVRNKTKENENKHREK